MARANSSNNELAAAGSYEELWQASEAYRELPYAVLGRITFIELTSPLLCDVDEPARTEKPLSSLLGDANTAYDYSRIVRHLYNKKRSVSRTPKDVDKQPAEPLKFDDVWTIFGRTWH